MFIFYVTVTKYFNKSSLRRKGLLWLLIWGDSPRLGRKLLGTPHPPSEGREQWLRAAAYCPAPFMQFRIPVSALCSPHNSSHVSQEILSNRQHLPTRQALSAEKCKRNGHSAMVLVESISSPCATVRFCLSTKELQWWVFCEVVWRPNYILSSIWNPVWEAVVQETHRLINLLR